jgi:hypothetical protein
LYFFSADGAVLHIIFPFNEWCRPYFNVNFLSAEAAVCILFSSLTMVSPYFTVAYLFMDGVARFGINLFVDGVVPF